MLFQAGAPVFLRKATPESGHWEIAINPASSARRSARNALWKPAAAMVNSWPPSGSSWGLMKGSCQRRGKVGVEPGQVLSFVGGEAGDADESDHVVGRAGHGDDSAPVGLAD